MHSPLSLVPFCAFYTHTHTHTYLGTRLLTRLFALSLIRTLIPLATRSLAHTHKRARRTLVDYLTRTRARPVTWPPIAKDVCGTAKSVRGGRSVEKEKIERRDRVEEKEGEDRTEEEILDRGYRLGSRDRRCSSSTCPKAFSARSFRLVPP